MGFLSTVKKIYWDLENITFDIMTDISPSLNTKLRYRKLNHKKLDLKNPKSFSEKLLKLKLENYDDNTLVKKCADKYTVRQYLKEQGLESVLIPVLGCYSSLDEIIWENLPKRFVIKLNVGCGYNYICTDKDIENEVKVKKTISKWIDEAPYYYRHAAEMQYKNVPIMIMIEEYIGEHTDILPEDYKFYCFNGEVKAILYIYGRESNEQAAVFFDKKWKYIGKTGKAVYKNLDHLPEEPMNFEEMVHVAERLAKGFPFVRVDLYNIQGKIFFGEMTFTPAGGLQPAECLVDGVSMGELLDKF